MLRNLKFIHMTDVKKLKPVLLQNLFGRNLRKKFYVNSAYLWAMILKIPLRLIHIKGDQITTRNVLEQAFLGLSTHFSIV